MSTDVPRRTDGRDEGFVLTLPSQASRPVEHVMWGLVLGLLACVPYFARSFDSEFIWDDDRHITQNKSIQSPSGLVNIWQPPGRHEAHQALEHPPQYYPLTHTTFWIEYQFFGQSPAGYRIDNAILHALSAVLLWLILRRLAVPGAWLGAAIFAVHPINAESVAWVTERKNVLSLLLALGAVWGYLRFMGEGSGFRVQGSGKSAAREAQPATSPWVFYALSLVLFVAAILSKTVACCVPAALVVIAWWKGRGVRRHLGLLAPFFLIGLGLAMHTAWLERVRIGAVGPDWDLNFGQRTLIAGRAVWFYIGKMLWPHPLIFTYPRWPVQQATAAQLLYPIAAVAVIAALALAALLGRRLRGVAAAAAIYLIVLVPAMGFFNVFPMRYSFAADHFAYFAMIPLAAGLAAVLWRAVESLLEDPIARTYTAAIGSTVILVALLVVLLKFQLPKYASNYDLWEHTLKYNDEAWMAHTNKAGQLLQRALVDLRHDELAGAMAVGQAAEFHYRRALELRPGHINALVGLSATHLCMASTVDAMVASMKARPATLPATLPATAPSTSPSTGPTTTAATRPASRPAPLPPVALGPEPTPVPPGVPTAAELRASALAEALEACRRTEDRNQAGSAEAAVSPIPARLQYARALRAQRRLEDAILEFYNAAKDDRSPSIRVELARTQWLFGDTNAALGTLDDVLADAPRNVEANMLRGEIHLARGEWDKAWDRFGRVIQIDPENVDAFVQRGFLWMERNRPQEAAKVIERALALDPQHPGARRAAMMIYQAISTQATTRVGTTRPGATRPATAPATTPATTRSTTQGATAPAAPAAPAAP